MVGRLIALLCALVVTAATGCSDSTGAAVRLPDPRELTSEAAAALDDQRSLTLSLRTTGAIPGFVVQSLEGFVSADGTGHGEVTVYDTATGADDVEFTVTDGVLELTDSDGVRSRLPARGLYAPSALFGRTSALGFLLDRATSLRTEGTEELDGVGTYRVAGRVPQALIAELLPRVSSDVEVKFWIGQTGQRRVHRVWLQVPPPRAGEGASMLELGLTRHDQPAPTDR